MKESIINQTTFVRYKLDQISELTFSECIDALQLLNYLLRRAEGEEAMEELRKLIVQIDGRVKELKELHPGLEEELNGLREDDDPES